MRKSIMVDQDTHYKVELLALHSEITNGELIKKIIDPKYQALESKIGKKGMEELFDLLKALRHRRRKPK